MSKVEMSDKTEKYYKLWVGDLHVDVNDADLLKIFNNAHHAKIKRDFISNVSLGHAYVSFSQIADGMIVFVFCLIVSSFISCVYIKICKTTQTMISFPY